VSLHPEPIRPVPEHTVRVARAAFPRGDNTYMRMRDEMGVIWEDEDFTPLFPTRGQPALAPWRLALVTVMQFAENLSDRQAANAVRARIDWKYALSLELTDPGFDFSVLSEFRSRLVEGAGEQLLLEKMLSRFKERGWVKARGSQRTDSTHVLAAVRALNRLELVGETLRAALNALAVVAPEWLAELAPSDWFERYSRPVDEYRLPKGIAARKEYAEIIGADGMKLLSAVDAVNGEDASSSPNSLKKLPELPAVLLLRRIWEDQYHIADGEARWREAKDLPPAGSRSGSPYDPDARFGNKRSITWTGYKLHLTETCGEDEPHIITRVETTQAHLSDVDQTRRIHEDLARRGLLPEEHVADAGFVDGELLVKSQAEYGVELVGPVRPNVGWQARVEGGYDLTRFEVDWEAEKVICPEGQTSNSWSPKVDKWGNKAIQVKFSRTACGKCESRALCTRARGEARTLTLRSKEEHEIIQSVRARQGTAEWKEGYDKRAGVEGSFSQSDRICGLRRARYRGLAKVRLEHVTTAAALNVVRTVQWLRGVPHAKTRTSRFAALKTSPSLC
jgi:transposase